MWKHLAANLLTFLIVALFLVAGAIAWGAREFRAEGPKDEPFCLRVPSGGSFSGVSADLVTAGALSSQMVFDLGVDYSNAAPRLKAGSFLVPAGTSMEGIVDIVTRGGASTCGTQVVYAVGISRTLARVRTLDPATNSFVETARFNVFEDEPPAEYLEVRDEGDTQYAVQVIEGTTVWQVVTALNALDVLEGTVEDLPREGMLAPDQYEFLPGATVAELVTEMEERQVAILSEAWSNRDEGIPLTSADEALILASIIEKETAVPSERELVSSVLTNRIEQGWPLQFDPTIIYGITRGEGLLGRAISLADRAGTTEQRLHGSIEYNTYQIDGLPAGPIANPGRASIEAAVAPAETDFMFFVALTLNPQDGHAFAVGINEHDANVARYRALEAEARAASDGN